LDERMNMKHRRVAALATALTAVSVLTACGGEDPSGGASPGPSAEAARRTLDAPSGPGSFVASGDARGRAYVAQMRSDQAAGRSTNPALVALTDEQLLALGRTTCTAERQGASAEQIQEAVADGMSGVSASDAAPYVTSAINTLCGKS
jgi:uncharacterized protein YoaH (UPF0181 family)